jgi:DNA polymerase I-like protein with 3'-5' exonuclease and polymerase domains
MHLLTDWDKQVCAFDFETSGTKPEYALQPWRMKNGRHDFWATSLVWMRREPELKAFGGLAPDHGMMREMLEEAISQKLIMLGWNTAFDISVLIAYGLDDLVFKVQWLDGMLIWKEYFLEPEYDTIRTKKKYYGLKPAVEEFLPQYAGYAEDVDFHDPSPEARAKLHQYNVRDVGFTWWVTKMLWEKLEPKQQMAALIKAECLPLVAQANFEGMLIDRLAMQELAEGLRRTADEKLAALAEHGITEKVVRSPLQLSALMYDTWKLPVLQEKTSEKTGKVSRSTSKEVLHELSFKDPRAKTVREYREALNNLKKFALTPVEAADYNGDDCAHPMAIPFGTYSGRFTYGSKQNKNAKPKAIVEEDNE